MIGCQTVSDANWKMLNSKMQNTCEVMRLGI